MTLKLENYIRSEHSEENLHAPKVCVHSESVLNLCVKGCIVLWIS